MENNEEIPNIQPRELQDWIRQKKRDVKPRHLPNKEEILKLLGLRDCVFIIDDAKTMEPYWRGAEGVVNLAKALTHMIKNIDKDGMELYLSSSGDFYRVKNATEMEKRLNRQLLNGTSDMALPLEGILKKYRKRLLGKVVKVKPLNIYIFTDAVWMKDCEDKVAGEIRSIVATLVAKRYPRSQVGIQFIQFGNNTVCSDKLQILDQGIGMNIPEGYDIVDTTPAAGGNCWKMLVGAICERYDKANESHTA